ncbi:MAG: hypothetical protein GY903_05805, partial [Fuerstiella sp.]|nr:hypothetical protein [Fuerstiella sp.]MCP4853988.1 hypothetical protein [Fuerstiella sp.]
MKKPLGILATLGALLCLLTQPASGDTVFIEAETMKPSSNGWSATSNDQTRRASLTKTMWGADGAGDAEARTTVRLGEAGRYRVWVRYMQVAAWRGPFQVAVATAQKTLAAKTFDL